VGIERQLEPVAAWIALRATSHLSDDKTVAKMGTQFRGGSGLVHPILDTRISFE